MALGKYLLLPFGPPGWVGLGLCVAHERAQDKALRREALRKAFSYQPTPIYGQHWATDDELRRAGRFRREGSLVGLSLQSNREILSGLESPNIISVASTSRGKTSLVGSAVLNDSLMKTSLFIPEVAGELAYITGDFRRRCGSVFRLDPYDVAPLPGLTRAFYDVMRLDWLNPRSKFFWPRSAKLSSLCVSKGSTREPYWSLKSRGGLQFATMAVRKYCDPRIANLPAVARIVCDDLPGFAKYIMRRCDDPAIAALGAPWANPHAEEIRSLNEVIENLRAELAFLLDPAVTEVLSYRPNFAPASMRHEVQTAFALLPGELMDGPVAKFLGLITGCCFAETMRPDPLARVELQTILDEMFVLNLENLPLLFATSRKFHVSIWGLIQDFAELKQMTDKTFSTVLGNSGTLQIMGIGVGDQDGAELVSKALGDTEVYATNKSLSYRVGKPQNDPDYVPEWTELQQISVQESYSQQRRRFMLPEEVVALDPTLQICWLQGVSAPVLCRKAPYYQTSAKWRAHRNPLRRGK